ncbi:hypothetical protein B0H66DRAFT_286852 [Apodospora peruviana]|uniref:Uncharacterized protein n=1 Tax=Apodospora peruviana TaxID=516989 RepID=A0AAE0I0N4_9PEZI|nr:hypothetical protein B0H66DRAFT_286852 [Apodospora peruviana]
MNRTEPTVALQDTRHEAVARSCSSNRIPLPVPIPFTSLGCPSPSAWSDTVPVVGRLRGGDWMNSSQGDDDGVGGVGEEGEPSEGNNRSKRRKIGRPPNHPKPPPRKSPVQIIPRGNVSSAYRDTHITTQERLPSARSCEQASPSTSPAGQATPASSSTPKTGGTHHRARRHRGSRQINTNNLAADERLTTLKAVDALGNWIVFPKAFISPHWPQNFIPAQTAEVLGLSPKKLEGAEIQTRITPRGRIRSTTGVVLSVELEQLNLPRHLLKLPVLETDDLGVSIIIGKPLIDWFYPNNWPPSEPTYVLPGFASYTHPVHLDAWPDNFYHVAYVDNDENAAADTNIHGDVAINYD